MKNNKKIIAAAFGRNFTGQPDSPMTVERKKYQQAITDAAKKADVSIDQYITSMLKEAEPQLVNYVSANGEIPLVSPVAVAAQATLLRADDIATVAKALDLTDEQALAEIERAEYDSFLANEPNTMILDIDTQAALCFAIWDFKDKTGGDLSAVLTQLRGTSPDNFSTELNAGAALSETFSNNGEFDNASGDPADSGIFSTDTGSSGSGSDWMSSGIFSTDTSGSSSGSSGGFDLSSLGDIFSGISSALNGVKGTSTGITGAINGVINNIKNSASAVGSSAIQDALTKKLPLILLGILVVAIIVIVIAKYASNRK
jgi:hypothetical protein